MKNVIYTIAILGILGVMAAPLMAGGNIHTNIIQVSHGYYGGGHHGGNYGHGYGGCNSYRVYYPPVLGYQHESRYFPNHPAIPPVMIPGTYYYHPRSSFYYSSPRVSVGIGF